MWTWNRGKGVGERVYKEHYYMVGSSPPHLSRVPDCLNPSFLPPSPLSKPKSPLNLPSPTPQFSLTTLNQPILSSYISPPSPVPTGVLSLGALAEMNLSAHSMGGGLEKYSFSPDLDG